MNYLHDVTRAQQRMATLMKEAHLNRQLPAEPGITDYLLNTVGTWMMNTGERLTRLSAIATESKKLSVIKTANG